METRTPIGVYKVQPGEAWMCAAAIAAEPETDGRSYVSVHLDTPEGHWYASRSVYAEQAMEGWTQVTINTIAIPPGCTTMRTYWETAEHTRGGWRLDSAVARVVRSLSPIL